MINLFESCSLLRNPWSFVLRKTSQDKDLELQQNSKFAVHTIIPRDPLPCTPVPVHPTSEHPFLPVARIPRLPGAVPHKGLQKPVRLSGSPLRVPLDAQHERAFGIFDGFDKPVGRRGGNAVGGSDAVDGLVVG